VIFPTIDGNSIDEYPGCRKTILFYISRLVISENTLTNDLPS